MVHVKAHKNPNFAIISEKYLQDIQASLDKNNVKQAKTRIESALNKLKEAQEGTKAPRPLTNYQKFSRDNYQKVTSDIQKETGVKPMFEQVSSRIGEMWREQNKQNQNKASTDKESKNNNNNNDK